MGSLIRIMIFLDNIRIGYRTYVAVKKILLLSPKNNSLSARVIEILNILLIFVDMDIF